MSGVEGEVSTLGNIEHWTLVGVERTIGQRRRVYVEVGTDGPALDAGEEVEVVRASTYQGAVDSAVAQTRSLMDAIERDLNDVGPWGNGYRQALADLREQLTLRFGGQ